MTPPIIALCFMSFYTQKRLVWLSRGKNMLHMPFKKQSIKHSRTFYSAPLLVLLLKHAPT